MINGWRYPKYEYKYAIGGKTGYTHVAQNTLVTYGEKNGMELVCVIMKAAGPKQGEPNEYTDTTKLLNYGFEKYQKYTVNQENEQIMPICLTTMAVTLTQTSLQSAWRMVPVLFSQREYHFLLQSNRSPTIKM